MLIITDTADIGEVMVTTPVNHQCWVLLVAGATDLVCVACGEGRVQNNLGRRVRA